MKWILVLHEHVLIRHTASDLLAEVVQDPVYMAGNLEEARELFADHGRTNCRLVVSSISPPLDADASPALDRSRPTALGLLGEVCRDDKGPAWLFLASYDDGARAPDLPCLPNVGTINVLHMARALRQQARVMLGTGTKPKRQVVVDIELVDGVYRWSLRGTDAFPLEKSGLIEVDPNEIRLLRTASRDAAGSDRAGIGRIGFGLYQHFLAHNLKSGLELALARAIGESIEEARFRFCVDQDTNELLLEALGKPGSQGKDATLDHWMLRSPIFRKYRGNSERRPLFKDEVSRANPVSCLIIQGESASFETCYTTRGGEHIPTRCNAIGLAAREALALHDYFTENSERFGLSSPVLLRPGDDGADYGAAVREALGRQRWQMIHYVGHSGISTRKTAFLALGRGRGDVLAVDEFARLASDAQFVYLSSCQSSNAQFVMKLVEQHIPAVLGYAWPVEDGDGFHFALDFYKRLFECGEPKRFLEYAFMHSKRELHALAPDRTAWAAPLLFMQMLAAEAPRIH